jgi:MFS family permease
MVTLINRQVRRPVPAEHRANFRHLYFDIAWFGILNGSTLSFISVYLARLGASAFQIGLFSASPAVVTLLLALPSGQWLKHKRLDRSAFWSAALFRFFYLFWILLPIWLDAQGQIQAFVAFTLFMSVPGTLLAISFNGLFAEAVPPEWRAHVAGIRNALLAASFIATSLLSGLLLNWLPFPLGYQVIFAIGFLGAALSTLHLWFIRLPSQAVRPAHPRPSLGDLAGPGVIRAQVHALRTSVGLRFLTRQSQPHIPRPGVLRTPFGKIILVLFLFHLTLTLPQPLFPLYWVDRLRLSDAEISMGNALFYVAVFLVSTQLSRLTSYWGHHRVMVLGAIVLFFYPTLTALMRDLPLFLVNSVIGGAGWSLAGGAVNNYLLENIPPGERPVHIAWYNLTLNGAILISSLTGPLLARQLGLVSALLLIGAGRMASALAIWYWGKPLSEAAAVVDRKLAVEQEQARSGE